MTFVEAEFWDLRVYPTQHSLQRFLDRALPIGTYTWDYVRAALRDLAVAEGFLVDYPPRWTRLAHSAPLYVVVGRFVCLPLMPHHRLAACWEPTTVVTEHEDLDWWAALDQGRVRLPPLPFQLPGSSPEQLQAARAAVYQQARQVVPDPPPPPRPRGLPLSPARWRALRAWWIERDLRRAQAKAQRDTYVQGQLAAVERLQQDQQQALAHWHAELWPNYQRTFAAVYQQARAGGPPVPPGRAPPFGGGPARPPG